MALITRDVAYWAAIECEKQRSGELSVAWMLDGWFYAHRHRNHPALLRDVLALGRMVEPRTNQNGLRKINVRVGWDTKMPPDTVPHATDVLLSAWSELESDEWFRMYEEIHPFGDGNGRTGSILWNWHRGTLPMPEVPPDYWSDKVMPPDEVRELAADVRKYASGIPSSWLRG
jgi:hypothetical protein